MKTKIIMEDQPNCKTCVHKGTDFYYGLCPQDDSEILPQEGNRCFYYREIKMININDMYDLVNVTFRDMYCINIDHEKKTIDIDCFFFTKRVGIKLPIAELMLYKDSAKGFLNYLKEEITRQVKEKSDE